MEVANGLLGSGIPQAILPGGTGNAMARDLNVPIDLRQAVELIVSSPKRRAVDLARIGDRAFMLRAYTGVSTQDAASREEKDKLGQLAYIQASMKIFTHMNPIHYRATVDGEVIEGDPLIVFILNAGSIGGVMGISLPQIGNVDVSDGYLDLYAVTKGFQPLRAISHHLFHIGESQAGIYHWRGKEITLESETPQEVWIDGEVGGFTPFTTSVIPQALEIVVPA
jgi:diacylglycerol kinase family enzyme